HFQLATGNLRNNGLGEFLSDRHRLIGILARVQEAPDARRDEGPDQFRVLLQQIPVHDDAIAYSVNAAVGVPENSRFLFRANFHTGHIPLPIAGDRLHFTGDPGWNAPRRIDVDYVDLAAVQLAPFDHSRPLLELRRTCWNRDRPALEVLQRLDIGLFEDHDRSWVAAVDRRDHDDVHVLGDAVPDHVAVRKSEHGRLARHE